MHIKDLVKEAHKTAVSKGFWTNKNIPEKIMLCVTELAEAVEALRKDKLQENTVNPKIWVKDSFEDEICDTFIRLADLCGQMNIDIEWQLKHKLAYNKKREYLHGKAF